MEKYEREEFIGQAAVWTFHFRGEPVSTLVKIIDARKLWDRVDLMVETNTGSRVWASTETVQPVNFPQPNQKLNGAESS